MTTFAEPPICPGCDCPAGIVLAGQQGVCTNTNCAVLIWDPSTISELFGDIHDIDFGVLPWSETG